MNKKVYVCEVEERGESGYTLVKVCKELDRAREWMRESFVAFKEQNAKDKYLCDNKEYSWFEGVVEGKNRWECYHQTEHIGWYVTEVEYEDGSQVSYMITATGVGIDTKVEQADSITEALVRMKEIADRFGMTEIETMTHYCIKGYSPVAKCDVEIEIHERKTK